MAATVSSAEKARLAKLAGADLVVNYRTEDVVAAVREWAPDGVSRVVEVDIGSNIAMDARVIATGGVISSYVAPTGSVPLPRALMSLNALLEFVLVYTVPTEAKQAAVDAITRAVDEARRRRSLCTGSRSQASLRRTTRSRAGR